MRGRQKSLTGKSSTAKSSAAKSFTKKISTKNSAQTEVLLVGNPNAGKSTLFNALTGGNAKVGNWHGVTVGELSRTAVFGGKELFFTDLPGIYSPDAMSMEEKRSAEYIAAHGEAFLLFVSECAQLPRTLPLVERLGKGRKCALVLTKRRQFERAGGFLDLPALSRYLGMEVLSSEGMKKRDLKASVFRLAEEGKGGGEFKITELPAKIYRPQSEELSRADRLLTDGRFALPLFLGLLLLLFWVTFAPNLLGDVLKTAIENFFTVTLAEKAQTISSPVLRGFVADGILGGVGAVLCFLPQIFLLFFGLILMEESGFLARLALLTDGMLSKIGLSGRAVFSLLMGFGCTAAAILTTRGLDDKKVQKRVILCLPYLPCSAKLPVFLTLASAFFENPFVAAVLLYALGVGFSLVAALLLKREAPPFVLELPPLQIPRPAFVAKSLYFQLKQFIIKLGTVILAFFLFSWLLSSFSWKWEYCAVEESMLAHLCGGLKFLFAPVGMNDWKIAYAALSGLIAKENVAGALQLFYGGFPYSAQSAFAFAVFLLCCSPCVSAIAATAKELGWGRALLFALVQTVTALLMSYLTYFLLTGGWGYALVALPPIIALFLLKDHEKIHRKRKLLSQKLHR